MEVREKLAILADAAKYDASCASSGSKKTRAGSGIGTTEGMGICHSYTPDGRCISLLKILLTNYCIYDCQYCVNRISSDTERARFTANEVISLAIEFYKRNYIEGLFLSSGIIQSSDYTMEQMIAVAKGLRKEQRFGGYIHLKTIPNASDELIREAGLWADRLSVNVELPTEADLVQLAPEKNTVEIVEAMNQIRDEIIQNRTDSKAGFRAPRFAPAGQSTQMIVGATETPDLEILKKSSALYEQQDLRRVYYSAYSPIPHADARLPGQSPPLIREHRLYQADWLLRFYGFSADEIVAEADRNLSLDKDPKLAWALANRHEFPVNVNFSPRERLLRVPGLGVRNVDRIIKLRRLQSIRSSDLKKLRVAWNRAQYFLETADHNPALKQFDLPNAETKIVEQHLIEPRRQLLLFDTDSSSITGEL
jgi:putative DNA modification/repair radical SAM protein